MNATTAIHIWKPTDAECARLGQAWENGTQLDKRESQALFDCFAKAFRDDPTARNWNRLQRAMATLQGASDRKR